MEYILFAFLALLASSGNTIFNKLGANKASAMSADAVEHLFDRFFTRKASRDSAGLGLSIAKTLAERLGGNITAEYRDGVLAIVVKL